MTISRSFQGILIAAAASVAVLQSSSEVLACQVSAGTSDAALMNTFPVPVSSSASEFVTQQAIDFELLSQAWTGHGFDAYDDDRLEYTKHWMSSYLIVHGNDFEHRVKGVGSQGQQIDLLLDRAFHTPIDYYTMAKGWPTDDWHDTFTSLLGGDDPVQLGLYEFSSHPPISAALFWPLAFFPEKTETVTTFCGLYDVQDHTDASVSGGPPISVFIANSVNIYGTPSERASDLVHEGMHAHYRDDREMDHVRCQGDPNDGGCDRFFSHPKSDFSGGDLNNANASTEKIPAYELQLEYLCDLVDEAEDWVPLALLSDAEATADRTAGNHFVTSDGVRVVPSYDCGVPSPMMEVPSSSCKFGACDASHECGQGLCIDGCCQVVR